MFPYSNDIRYHLNKINNFEELETRINQALKSRIPLGLKKGCLKIAIDLNLICYYGHPTLEELPYIYRSQAKSGTCSFYAYATLYVITLNKRITLAIRGVRRFDTSVAIITYLLAELDFLKINVKKLYLDRGFFNTPGSSEYMLISQSYERRDQGFSPHTSNFCILGYGFHQKPRRAILL